MKKNWIKFVLVIILGLLLFYMSNANPNSDLPVISEYAETEFAETVEAEDTVEVTETTDAVQIKEYRFRNSKLLNQHYDKHGKEMGFASALEYEAAASDVVNNPNALNKIEAEDGDFVYYVEETNEFVVLSTDGYIRTYFLPDSGKKYYDKQ